MGIRIPDREEADAIGSRIAIHLAKGETEMAERVLRGCIAGLQNCEHWSDDYATEDELPLALASLPSSILNRLAGFQVETVGAFRRGNPSTWNGVGGGRLEIAQKAVDALVVEFNLRKGRKRRTHVSE